MKKQNFAIHIYTSHRNKDRCLMIEKTWGQHIDNLYFYTDKLYSDTRYIHCTNNDDYFSHMKKNFFAFQNAYTMKDIDWHLFSGDDTFIYHYNLEHLIDNLNKNSNIVVGLHLYGTYTPDKNLEYIGGGPGLLLNSVSLNNLIKNDTFSDEEKKIINYSDVVVGYICQKANIQLVNQSHMMNSPPEYYGISNPEKYISFHYIKTKEQFDNLYQNYIFK